MDSAGEVGLATGGWHACRGAVVLVRYLCIVALNLRLTKEQDQLLSELARSQGMSKNEAAARAIEEAWVRRAHQGEVRELARAAAERYAALLDRLAQ